MKTGEKGLLGIGKGIKKTIAQAPLIFLTVGMFLFLIFAVHFHINAESTGRSIGERTGSTVGKAIGSIEGLTKGQQEGFIAGKEKGLSAEDTVVELSGKIREVQRLQVLVASGTFSDILSVGDDYAALLAMKYNAVFTVDLSTAEIDLKDDGLHILLEQPAVGFYPVGEIEKMNEYQKWSWTGSAGDGYTAVNNSANQMKIKATEKLAGDDSMMAAARASAETQLTQLINAVSLSKPKVLIEFRAVEGAKASNE